MFEVASNERANYARLLCLLVEQGTECMKKFVLANLPHDDADAPADGYGERQLLLPHAQNNTSSLHEVLLDKKDIFDGLKKGKKISNDVYKQLFPASGVPLDEDKLDMTCWYVLSRNLAVNQPRVNYSRLEVHPPKPNQRLPQHNIIRIRNMRNTLFHLESTNLETSTFNTMWTELSMALRSLGASDSVLDEYKTRELDPMTTMTHYIRLREQVYQDLENVYTWEIKKKKFLITSLIGLGAMLVVLALASNCITYVYARTWSSCIHSMVTHLTGNNLTTC